MGIIVTVTPLPLFVTLGDGGISVAPPALQAVTVVDGGPITVSGTVSVGNIAPIYVTLGDGGGSGGGTITQPLAVTVVDGGPLTVAFGQPLGVTVVDGGLNVTNLPTF